MSQAVIPHIQAMKAGNSSERVDSPGDTLIKSGAGVLVAVINNKPVASSIVTIFDGVNNTGTVLLKITNPLVLLQQQIAQTYNISFTTGLFITTTAIDDLTIIYR